MRHISRGALAACMSLFTTSLMSATAIASYIQPPDPNGWAIPNIAQRTISDDWVSTFSGVVTSVNLFVAWQGDQPPGIYAPYLTVAGWYPEIASYSEVPYMQGDQGWYIPFAPASYALHDHVGIWKLTYLMTGSIPPPIVQAGQSYGISFYLYQGAGLMGWCTSSLQVGSPATSHDPFTHQNLPVTDPLTSRPLDMAFEIVPEPLSLALWASAICLRKHSRGQRVRSEA